MQVIPEAANSRQRCDRKSRSRCFRKKAQPHCRTCYLYPGWPGSGVVRLPVGSRLLGCQSVERDRQRPSFLTHSSVGGSMKVNAMCAMLGARWWMEAARDRPAKVVAVPATFHSALPGVAGYGLACWRCTLRRWLLSRTFKLVSSSIDSSFFSHHNALAALTSKLRRRLRRLSLFVLHR